MLKLCFFEVYNTVVSIAAFFIDSSVWHNSRQWYSLGGAMLVNILIGDAVILQWLLDGGPLCQLGILWSARRARTQIEMNERYAEPAGIVLAFRLSLAGKFVVLAIWFGPAIPILYLVAAYFFWSASWLDRYILLRKTVPPPRTDAWLMNHVARSVIPISILLHVSLALAVYAQIPLDARSRRWWAGQLGMVRNITNEASSDLTAANSTMASSGNQSATSFNASTYPPPSIPLPASPPSPPDESAEWLAFYITLGVAGVALLALIFFLLREDARSDISCLRKSRCGRLLLRALPSERKAHFALRTLAGELDDAKKLISLMQPDLHASRTQRYSPPLTPKLLEALAQGAARRRQVSLHGILPPPAVTQAASGTSTLSLTRSSTDSTASPSAAESGVQEASAEQPQGEPPAPAPPVPPLGKGGGGHDAVADALSATLGESLGTARRVISNFCSNTFGQPGPLPPPSSACTATGGSSPTIPLASPRLEDTNHIDDSDRADKLPSSPSAVDPDVAERMGTVRAAKVAGSVVQEV